MDSAVTASSSVSAAAMSMRMARSCTMISRCSWRRCRARSTSRSRSAVWTTSSCRTRSSAQRWGSLIQAEPRTSQACCGWMEQGAASGIQRAQGRQIGRGDVQRLGQVTQQGDRHCANAVQRPPAHAHEAQQGRGCSAVSRGDNQRLGLALHLDPAAKPRYGCLR